MRLSRGNLTVARKTRNPARVDATVRQHLRRKDRTLRASVIVSAVAALLFVALLFFRPVSSRRLAVLGAFAAVVSLLAALVPG